jgi:ABC-type multidrug transport system fused ATPase/permease subunit
VALNRIATYLDEDEVSAQVSTLKKAALPPSEEELEEDGLGIENGSFKWNEVPEGEKEEEEEGSKKRSINVSTDESVVTEGTEDDGVREEAGVGAGDHRFELRDIDVMFPEGELTVITGPTASGKTALLVRPHFPCGNVL